MRICYVADAGSPHVEKWAGHFAQAHEVDVISFRPGVIPGARVHVLGRFGSLGKARYVIEAVRARRLIRDLRPDVVHALHLTSYGFVAALAGYHPLVSSVWGYDILQAPERSLPHRWVTRFALRRADVITATGEALAEATRPFAPMGRAIHVVPYGIDLDRFPARPGAGGHVIGAVKALLPSKGFAYLLDAMPIVLARHPDARVLLVGEGPERPRLEQQARALGIAGSVEFAGEAAHEAVPSYLARMDVFVQPSLTESFGVSALEASASALPVVAAEVEGGREIVRDGETGILVPPGDSAALAEALLRLLDDAALRASMGAAGRHYVEERYNWPENAARMEALYREAVEARGSSR